MLKFLLFGSAILCYADTRIVSIDPTQMQAKIEVHTDQAGSCTYRASRGEVFSTNLPDLIDNGATDARAGSLVQDGRHIFVLGTRKGADALTTAAGYWVGVSCGADAEVTAKFTTLPVPWGNMAPDPVPFNSSRFGNMDYPTIDWNDQSKSYVDPVEGIEFWRLTSPGMLNAGAFVAQFNQTSGPPIDLAGRGNWVNASGAGSNGTAFANARGDATDRLFVPISSSVFYGGGGWTPATGVDDILANVFCGNASQSGITLSLQLTFDGGQTVVGAPVGVACPAASPAKIGAFPQAGPLPMFRGWGINPPQHNLVIPPSGTVSVASSVVTLQSPSLSNNYFMTEWVAGTPILINSNYYHIASIQSPTQLTIVEDPGTLTNVPYAGANSGLVVIKNGAGNVDVSLGLDLYGSSVADNNTNADLPMVNPIPVNVSKSADGLTTWNPTIKGYLMAVSSGGGAGAILLWIPYNADGSVRNEVRLLSQGTKNGSSPSMNLRGDNAEYQFGVGASPNHTTAFDGVNGDRWYALGKMTNSHFFRMTYDETLPGCAGYPAYKPFPASGGYNNSTATIADDCFQWYNLTPSSTNPRMDVLAQIKQAYVTGLNAAGEAVGPPHPGFDLGWFNDPASGITGAGYLTASIANSGEHLGISAAFDISTGLIKVVKNMWGGDGDSEARWGGVHGIPFTAGSWRFASMNALDDNGSASARPFNTSFDLPIARVNRAGFAQGAQWDAVGQTALAGAEAYSCPPDNLLPARFQIASMRALGYSGPALGGSNNCVQVKVATPPCNASPNSTYVFPDGKTEKDEFPCTTPGFGVADANRSKLMDMRPGDWMLERRTGPGNEKFVALTISYNGANDIDIWLLRWARHNYLLPLLDNGDDFVPVYESRPNGWFLSMAPSFSTTSSSMAIDYSAGPAAAWMADNGDRSAIHGVIGPGSAPGLFIYASPNGEDSYRGQFNVTVPQMLFQRFLPLGAAYPRFAGSRNGVFYGITQNYNNNSWSFGAATPPFQLDLRHLNPSFGSGPEFLGSGIGAPRSLTPVAGTSKSYLIQDTVSVGPSDYKRLPLFGFAGHYLLKDVSGPATGNSADLPDYSVCRALRAAECFAGSAAGNLYVTVPKAFVDNYCRTNQFTLPDPCAFQLAPYAGQLIQFRTDKPDIIGMNARKMGYLHGMPGLQYQFSNCRATPDAAFAFCVADWLDGVRGEWIALRLTPMPRPDSVDRTTFVPISLTYSGSPDASFIRARFGYLENGGSLLRCTPYQSDCTTEIPAATATDPYGFTSETLTRQPCPQGTECKVTIPAISNRMLYYVLDRLDNSGNIVFSYPPEVIAVP